MLQCSCGPTRCNVLRVAWPLGVASTERPICIKERGDILPDSKHDKLDGGFNISPEILEHDLTMLKLSQLPDVASLDEQELYNEYKKILKEFHGLVDDKTRYDSIFDK